MNNLTPYIFKHQNAIWQDKWYSYAIHRTDGGAMYLYRIDGKRITQKAIDNTLQVFRLDGMNFDLFMENVKKVQSEQ